MHGNGLFVGDIVQEWKVKYVYSLALDLKKLGRIVGQLDFGEARFSKSFRRDYEVASQYKFCNKIVYVCYDKFPTWQTWDIKQSPKAFHQ